MRYLAVLTSQAFFAVSVGFGENLGTDSLVMSAK